MKVVFRADASQDEGGGHLIRSLVIAKELANRGHDCKIITQEGGIDLIPGGNTSFIKQNLTFKQIKKNEFDKPQALFDQLEQNWLPDLCFIDSYRLKKDYQTQIRKLNSKIVVLDDMPWREHDTDILIDPTLNREGDEYKNLVPGHTKLLCGVKYAPLRSEFLKARQTHTDTRTRNEKRKHILVSLGLTDPDNITSAVLEGLLKVQKEIDVTVLISSQSPFEQEIELLISEFKFKAQILHSQSDMAGLLSRSDLVIGAGGSSSWERCCLGVPALQLILADNQKDVTHSLVNTGAIQSLGFLRDFRPEIVTESVDSILADNQTLKTMSEAALKVCDGLGAVRIADYAESIRA